MALGVKISLLFSGLFLLSGILTGIWKYAKMMSSETRQTPVVVYV